MAKVFTLPDGRNEQSKEVAQTLLNGFRETKIKEGYTSITLDMMSKPSGYLGMI